MEISAAQFRANCLKLIDEVHLTHTEVVITKHGKPLAKLVYIDEESPQQFVGTLCNIGKTTGDLKAVNMIQHSDIFHTSNTFFHFLPYPSKNVHSRNLDTYLVFP